MTVLPCMAGTAPTPTVVVVDDSRTMRMSLRLVLEDLGIEVVAEGESGRDVQPLYERYQPDVMFVDIIMPGPDGLKSVRKLVNSHPEARVIMCTSLTRRDKVMECKKAGAAHYLVKPFTVDTVKASMRRALSFRRRNA